MAPSAKAENVTLETTGFAAKQLSLKEEGLYIVAVTRREAYNTSYRENGKVVLVKGTKEGRKDVVSSTYSQQFAKSLILSAAHTHSLSFLGLLSTQETISHHSENNTCL